MKRVPDQIFVGMRLGHYVLPGVVGATLDDHNLRAVTSVIGGEEAQARSMASCVSGNAATQWTRVATVCNGVIKRHAGGRHGECNTIL